MATEHRNEGYFGMGAPQTNRRSDWTFQRGPEAATPMTVNVYTPTLPSLVEPDMRLYNNSSMLSLTQVLP